MSIGITGLLVGTRNLPSATQFFTIPSRRLVIVELMSLHVTIAFNATRGFVGSAKQVLQSSGHCLASALICSLIREFSCAACLWSCVSAFAVECRPC